MKLRLGLILLMACAFAQEPIRVNTRLVEVNVIARDPNGAVAGLTADDFKLFDNGKEQRIAVFKVSRTTRSEEPPPATGVVSNRDQAHDDQAHSATVLMIDTLNTEFGDQILAKKNIQRLLNSFDATKKLNQPIALYLLGESIQVLHGFTTDVEPLRKAIATFNPQESREYQGANETGPTGRDRASRAGRRAAANVRDFYNTERVDMTIDTFKQLAQYLAPVPGRKKVIWISDAFPSRYIQPNWMQLLNQADVAIYGVHAKGLTVSRRDQGKDALFQVADATGGLALTNTNDFAGAIRTAMDDAEITYTLGFYAQDQKSDGSVHQLKVKVDRPGIELRHRNGYSATEAAPFDVSRIEDTLRQTAAAPFDATTVGISATIERAESAGSTTGSFRIVVQLNVADLALDNQNSRWVGATQIAFVAVHPDGRTQILSNKTIQFNLTEEGYTTRRREGVAIQQTIAVNPAVAQLRLVVLDHRSGATGSLTLAPKP